MNTDAVTEDRLREVIENPFRYDARQRYADYIETRDRPRADFIRLQLSMEHDPDQVSYERADDLLVEHGPRWRADALGLASFDSIARRIFVGWRRGFIERVSITAPDLLMHGGFAARTPLLCVEVLALDGLSLSDVLECPVVRRSKALSLASLALDDKDVTLIVENGITADVRWLDLSNNRITDIGFSALLSSALLHNVRWIGLSGNFVFRLPRPGGVDHGQVIDTHWPIENIPMGTGPEWLRNMAAGFRPDWFDCFQYWET